jgi:hypothetical protein
LEINLLLQQPHQHLSSLRIALLLTSTFPCLSPSNCHYLCCIMSGGPIPINVSSPSGSSSSSSLWDRLSTWASENKAVVYTIAGTAVIITGAGVVYYLSESRKTNQGASLSGEKRKSKKERRKEKKVAEDGKSASVGAKDEEAGTHLHQAPRSHADFL